MARHHQRIKQVRRHARVLDMDDLRRRAGGVRAAPQCQREPGHPASTGDQDVGELAGMGAALKLACRHRIEWQARHPRRQPRQQPDHAVRRYRIFLKIPRRMHPAHRIGQRHRLQPHARRAVADNPDLHRPGPFSFGL